MLDLVDVSRRYFVGGSEVLALQAATLRITDGDFVAIVGPSGSGKSTLLQMIGLLDRPSSGALVLDGQHTAGLDDEQRARLRLLSIGFVFQRFHLLADLTAMENVALPMEIAGTDPAERYARAASLLAEVGLGDRQLFLPAQLSGGQRQRVAIARALANNPRLILADEPTGELHTEDKSAIIALFEHLNRQGHTVVLVTHDVEVASVARRHVEIRDGIVKETS